MEWNCFDLVSVALHHLTCRCHCRWPSPYRPNALMYVSESVTRQRCYTCGRTGTHTLYSCTYTRTKRITKNMTHTVQQSTHAYREHCTENTQTHILNSPHTHKYSPHTQGHYMYIKWTHNYRVNKQKHSRKPRTVHTKRNPHIQYNTNTNTKKYILEQNRDCTEYTHKHTKHIHWYRKYEYTQKHLNIHRTTPHIV